jgi:radical SAM protein with 4Fe4S-binding SPASM domain
MSLGLSGNSGNCFDGMDVQIEPTYMCNLKCIICEHTYKQKVHGDIAPFFEFEDFIELINSLVEFCKTEGTIIRTLQLFWYGEPFFHKQIIKLLEYVLFKNSEAKVFDQIRIDTSFAHIKKSQIEHITKMCNYLNDRSLHLTFSLDATSKKVYDKIRPYGNLDKTIENIHYLISLKDKYNLFSPVLNFQFIVQPDNCNQANEFIKYWKSVLESRKHPNPEDSIQLKRLIILKQYFNSEEIIKKQIHETTISKLSFKPFSSKYGFLTIDDFPMDSPQPSKPLGRLPCASLWKQPSIASNGDLTFCCQDLDLKYKLGNINKQPFSELWQGKQINEYRHNHLQNLFSSPEICSACSTTPHLSMSQAEIKNFLTRFRKRV